MSDILPADGLVLHVWPGQWGLPSFDPLSLAAVLYLQLAIPGKFCIAETSNPDASPTGQLPFLVHEQYVVSSFPSIIKYVSDLRNADHAMYPDANLDINLTVSEKAQKTAWSAHADSHLGDLVYHTLYSMDENWTKLTGPTLASMFPVPQKYYVPRRIRDGYFPKLEASGLWNTPVQEKHTDKPFQKDVKPLAKEGLKKNSKVTQAFEREKVIQKARAEFDIYKELLDGKSFIFQNQPSSVDILIAAHILLLLNPPFPDPLFKNLILDSYPSLASHARQIYDLALGEGKPRKLTSSSSSLWSLLPSWPKRPRTSQKSQSPEDIHYNRMRWGFFGLVVGSFAAYLAIVGSQYRIVWLDAQEHNREDDEEEEEEEELEEKIEEVEPTS